MTMFWTPRHPSPTSDYLYSATLGEDEWLETFNYGHIIEAFRINTTKRSPCQFGKNQVLAKIHVREWGCSTADKWQPNTPHERHFANH